MEPIKVKVVPCPCCKKDLYSVVERDALYLSKKNNPNIEKDNQGAFLKCPHCSKRISLRLAPSLSGIPQFELDDIQPCNSKLP